MVGKVSTTAAAGNTKANLTPRIVHLLPPPSASPAIKPTTMWILRYQYVNDILEKRGPYRAGHIANAHAGVQKVSSSSSSSSN